MRGRGSKVPCAPEFGFSGYLTLTPQPLSSDGAKHVHRLDIEGRRGGRGPVKGALGRWCEARSSPSYRRRAGEEERRREGEKERRREGEEGG